MSGNFVLFPNVATQPATLPAGFDDEALIGQLLPQQQAQLRVEIRQMAEWNRRAILMMVPNLPGVTAAEASSAAIAAQHIDSWFSNQLWISNIDATTAPVATAIDPARVAALAKIAGRAAQQLALISTVVGAINAATVLLTALQTDGKLKQALDAPMMGIADGPAQKPGAADAAPAAGGGSPTPQAGATADAAATSAMLQLISNRVGANEAFIKTVLGTVPTSTDPVGKTTSGDGSGTLEGTLLSADVIAMCARTIAERVKARLGSSASSIILLNGDQTLEVGLWRAVQARIAALRTTANDAMAKVADAEAALGLKREVGSTGDMAGLAILPIAAAVTAIGTLVSNAANLAGYFQTSWTSKGITIEGVNDQFFGTAVAAALAGDIKLYVPGAAADEAKAHELIQELLKLRHEAQIGKSTVEELQKALLAPTPVPPSSTDMSATPTPPPVPLLATLAAASAAIGAETAVIQACDAMVTSLVAPDATGRLPLTELSSQASLGKAVDEGAKILRVRVHKIVSGLYTREDSRIRAFFRSKDQDAPDLHVSGGAVVSFLLQDPDGGVLEASTLRDQTEYLQLDDVNRWLENKDD